MTRDGMCGLFIPDRVLAGWWRGQWLITSTEMGVSTSADPGSRCCTNSGREGIRRLHHSDPTRTRSYIPAPSTTCYAPNRPLPVTRLHWLLHQPARTLSGINTPHIPSLVILHPPAYEDGTDGGFRNVGYEHCDAGELPKRKHITYRTRRKLKTKNNNTKLPKFQIAKASFKCSLLICGKDQQIVFYNFS